MKNLLILLLIFCGLSASSQQKDILKVLKTQQEAWNRGDLDGFMEGYEKSDSLLFIGSRGPNYGWQKTLDNYKKSYPNKEKMGILEFENIRVKMLGRKYAQVLGNWRLQRQNDTPGGIFTLIFEKFRNGWKIISDHTQ